MALIEQRGFRPSADPTTRLAPNATICGDVNIGPNTSIGFGVVITAESGPVWNGANCVIMDTAVIRGVRKDPVRIEQRPCGSARLPRRLYHRR
jgi:carbonic anhydrase/acetyltransferase-like protein (isoleucine patch superfamily)